MAKSKYQQELEDFKKSLPAILIETAHEFDIHPCDDGLQALFDRLGVKWERPRVEHDACLTMRLNLPGTESDRYSVTDEADERTREIIRDVNVYLKNTYPDEYIADSLYMDEVYVR